MTVEATTPPLTSAEDILRSRALDNIRSRTLDVILRSDEPLRTVDVARLVGKELQLTLGDEELGGLASVVRMVLDSEPLYSQANRQWDLALRMGRAEADRRKPVERAVLDFADLIGYPVSPHAIGVLIAAAYGRDPEYYAQMIERLIKTREDFFAVPKGRFGIARWLIEPTSDEPDEVLEDNFSDTIAVDQLRPAAENVRAEDAAAFARSVIQQAAVPVDGRALLYLTWERFPDVNPRELFLALYADPELRIQRGPAWIPTAEYDRLLATIRDLVKNPEAAASLVAATAPEEDEAQVGLMSATVVRVSDEDLEHIYELMLRDERSYRVAELCQDALEAFPGSRTYAQIYDSLITRLREDERFVWVGFDRFRLSGTLPAEVEQLPEGLAYNEEDYLDEEGAEIDRLLPVEDWKFNLDEQIQHYLVQDVGDDSSEFPATPPELLEASPPLHHFVAGTRYLRHADRGFFPAEPDIVQASIVAPDGSRFDVWINNRLGLLFGLKEWYDAHLPWVGGKFAIEHGEQPDEYRLVYNGEVEPLMDISEERLQQLLMLRAEAASERLSLSEIITRILRDHPEGLHFVTLFTQVNVVRRIRRAQLASALSAQRFFVQSPQTPGIWSYDEKRAQKGKKKGGPKRPIREYFDEEEDLDFDIIE